MPPERLVARQANRPESRLALMRAHRAAPSFRYSNWTLPENRSLYETTGYDGDSWLADQSVDALTQD
jgi:hypothetical protein